MSLSENDKQVAIELLIEKSQRNMQQAIKNAELDYWDLVANRLYYSMFHAVTALKSFLIFCPIPNLSENGQRTTANGQRKKFCY